MDNIQEKKEAIEKKKTRPYTLDYTIKSLEERTKLVNQIVNNTSPQRLTSHYLEELANYLIDIKQIKKEKHEILTDNIMVTVNKRETSFEGLIEKFENGQDGIYSLLTGGDKNIYLVPKVKEITEEEIKIIPGLKELKQAIEKIQKQQKAATGMRKYSLTKQLIEMRQQQYQLRMAYNPPIMFNHITKSKSSIKISEDVIINEKGEPEGTGVFSFFNPYHISCLLLNYSKLKEDAWGKFQDDWWYLMEDFDNLSERALKQNYPMLYDIMVYKIDGMQNKDIALKIKQDYGTTYAAQYLSSLWRKKIPKLIAEKAKQEWIIWHFTFEQKGKWKRCSRCHEIKLAHPYFYTRNKSSKDGWYSMCKCCRNKKIDKDMVKKK